jgi:hypothetical protein
MQHDCLWSHVPPTYLLFHQLQGVVQKSVILKLSPVLTGFVRFKLVSQYVERYRSVLSCGLNTKDLILINFCKSTAGWRNLNYLNVNFTNQLTGFLADMYLLFLIYATLQREQLIQRRYVNEIKCVIFYIGYLWVILKCTIMKHANNRADVDVWRTV